MVMMEFRMAVIGNFCSPEIVWYDGIAVIKPTEKTHPLLYSCYSTTKPDDNPVLNFFSPRVKLKKGGERVKRISIQVYTVEEEGPWVTLWNMEQTRKSFENKYGCVQLIQTLKRGKNCVISSQILPPLQYFSPTLCLCNLDLHGNA